MATSRADRDGNVALEVLLRRCTLVSATATSRYVDINQWTSGPDRARERAFGPEQPPAPRRLEATLTIGISGDATTIEDLKARLIALLAVPDR